MAKTKKLVFCAATLLILGILIATLCGNAARVESNGGEYASYDVATGTVTYYSVVNEDSSNSENDGGDYSFNPAEISK